jgi:hypothetical protein
MRSWLRVSTIGWIALVLFAAGCGSTAVDDGPSPEAAISQPSGSPKSPGSDERSDPNEQLSPEPGVRVIEAAIEDSRVRTSSPRVDVTLGETLRLVITADTDDELHVHGYDLRMPIAKGRASTLEFVADIPGVFEVELEEAGLEIIELRVG